MLSKGCSHNVPWGDRCRECEYVSDLETIRIFMPMVKTAVRRVEEYETEKRECACNEEVPK